MVTAARVGWAGLLLAAGTWPLSTAWTGTGPLIVLLALAVGPLLLVVLGSRLRIPPVATAGVILAGGLVAGYRLALPAGVAPASALRDLVARLLTEARPAPARPDLLLPGAVLVLVTGVWVALRAHDSGSDRRRGRGLVAAPIGAVVLYGAGALLSAGAADPHGMLATAIVGLSAAGWFVLDTPRPPSVATTRLAAPVALAAAVALAAVAVGTGPGFEPRRLVDPPLRTLQQSSPLPRIAAWQQLGDVELLRATVDSGARLRLVVLTDYTGATWSASATYRRPGTAAENPLPASRQRTVSAQVSITGLEGPWLPTPGRSVTVSLSDVDVEPDTGSLAARDGATPPGMTYSVSAVVDAPNADEVAVAGVPAGPSVERLLRLPSLPWTFPDFARHVTYGASTPFEQAVAIEYAIRDGRRLDPTAPVGSSYARIDTFLFRPAGSEPGAQAGTSEQFATAFAVLARSVGLPTRVVVGFDAGVPGPDGSRVVRGRDARAWPEVYFAGLGWFAFDPSPTAEVTPAEQQLKLKVLDRMGAQVARVNPVPPPTITPNPSLPGPPGPGPGLAAGGPGAGTGGLAASLAAVPVALALALLFVVVARRVRRARHRRSGDRGAWSEVLDLLVLMGQPAGRGRPAPEIATALALAAPVHSGHRHPAELIAASADRAAFSPDSTGSAGAWSMMGELRRAVRTAVPWRRRLFWPLDPRPLLRGRRRR